MITEIFKSKDWEFITTAVILEDKKQLVLLKHKVDLKEFDLIKLTQLLISYDLIKFDFGVGMIYINENNIEKIKKLYNVEYN